MSERWKYQLRTGLVWGITLPVCMTLLEAWSLGNFNIFLTLKFVAKVVIFCTLGVFLVGCHNWKTLQKSKKKSPHDHAVDK